MKLSQAKTYGGVGAILSLVGGFVPFAGEVVSIIGLILVLIAVKYISDEARKKEIFNNYLIAFILSIVSIIIAIAAFITFIGTDILFNMAKLKELYNFTGLKHLAAGIIVALLIFWIMLIISSLFLRKSYYTIAEHTHVDLFHTTGLLYFIGALTLIVIIGAFIILIAKILEIISFFSLPEELPEKSEEPI